MVKFVASVLCALAATQEVSALSLSSVNVKKGVAQQRRHKKNVDPVTKVFKSVKQAVNRFEVPKVKKSNKAVKSRDGDLTAPVKMPVKTVIAAATAFMVAAESFAQFGGQALFGQQDGMLFTDGQQWGSNIATPANWNSGVIASLFLMSIFGSVWLFTPFGQSDRSKGASLASFLNKDGYWVALAFFLYGVIALHDMLIWNEPMEFVAGQGLFKFDNLPQILNVIKAFALPVTALLTTIVGSDALAIGQRAASSEKSLMAVVLAGFFTMSGMLSTEMAVHTNELTWLNWPVDTADNQKYQSLVLSIAGWVSVAVLLANTVVPFFAYSNIEVGAPALVPIAWYFIATAFNLFDDNRETVFDLYNPFLSIDGVNGDIYLTVWKVATIGAGSLIGLAAIWENFVAPFLG